jgi:hypothetical protein
MAVIHIPVCFSAHSLLLSGSCMHAAITLAALSTQVY